MEVTPFATFTKQLTFDAFGRTDTETSMAQVNTGKSSSKTIKNTYKNGFPWQIIDNSSQVVLWQTNTVNARGQLVNASLGNGISIANTYDTFGLISQTQHNQGSANKMTLNTVFDAQRGNLTSRTNSLFNWNESFTYDAQDRLLTWKNGTGVIENQTYDNRGRIRSNAIGDYAYSNTAYQNSSIQLTNDAKNYYNAKPKQTISYTAFKSPLEIEEVGVDKISFIYNDGNDRSAMFYGSTAVDKYSRPNRKYYSADGSMEIKVNIPNNKVEFITYIGGDAYSAPLLVKSDGVTQNFLYLHRDYQGSILAITDANATVVEKRLFDAWGSLINYYNVAGASFGGWGAFDRGYTGHEHLTSVGLINMNARLYDPKLHRFLQPDNYVQEPFNTQNYNRYGYCWNNPLKFTDPSGNFTWSDLIASVSIVVGVVIVITSSGALTPLAQGFIGAGAAHFGATFAMYMNNKAAGWDTASNYIGFRSPTININTGWGDSKKDKNGVTENAPVVKPETIAKDDVRNMSSSSSSSSSSSVNGKYESSFYKNQYFKTEASLRAGTYIDFSPFKKLFGITLGEYKESSIKAEYYDNKGSITKSHNHFFEAGVAYGIGVDFKYNLGESTWDSFSFSLFSFNLEWSKQSPYQYQFFAGFNSGISAGIGVGGNTNINGGWRWDY